MSLLLIKDINEIMPENILCYDKQKNNVMLNSDFYKIIYSDNLCTFNALFFSFMFKNITIEKYFNKLKFTIANNTHNTNIINKIYNIEKQLLNKFKHNYPQCKLVYRLYYQLNTYNIKLQNTNVFKNFKNKEVNFYIKISGIWCSNENKECGLTFKFFIQK